MSLPWYYLERPIRLKLLRAYYTVCAMTYPVYVAINYQSYIPDRAQVLSGRTLREEIVNSNKKKIV